MLQSANLRDLVSMILQFLLFLQNEIREGPERLVFKTQQFSESVLECLKSRKLISTSDGLHIFRNPNSSPAVVSSRDSFSFFFAGIRDSFKA
jgi:hypothetical protein